MEFTVPQFIEYEAKVIGPFTFKQFIIVGGAGIVCFAFFLKTPIYVALPISIFIGGGAAVLSLLKIGGRSPLVVFKNFLFYNMSPRVYIWERKVIVPKIIKKEEVEEESPSKAIRRSRLSELSTKVETKTE